jgi:hypothetical protein
MVVGEETGGKTCVNLDVWDRLTTISLKNKMEEDNCWLLNFVSLSIKHLI